ncbi:tenascin-R-like [Scylla paramamosain]|uniref:tenascin-R-like n=1 Tax=Scylla paramamosain TaxID=85552 RepID=UPI0030839A83
MANPGDFWFDCSDAFSFVREGHMLLKFSNRVQKGPKYPDVPEVEAHRVAPPLAFTHLRDDQSRPGPPCPAQPSPAQPLPSSSRLTQGYILTGWLSVLQPSPLRQSRLVSGDIDTRQSVSDMWVSVYAIVVLGAAGVLAESPQNDKAAKRQGIFTWPSETTDTIITETRTKPEPTDSNTNTPYPIHSSVRPVDCADHLMAGATVSGVYEIYPFTCTCGKPVLVWCDMETDGGGWTVFLRRQHQRVQLDFNRTWDDYKAGFGSPYSEYYLGNDLLHQMTYSRAYGIRLDVGLVSGGYDFATYENFRVNSEDNRYSAYMTGSLTGGSSSTSCLRYMSGRSFTTLDRDHDSYGGNCASVRGGAWWYYNCRYFNPTSTFNTSLQLTCYGASRPVTQLQLKLRPAICDSSFKTIHLMDMGCGCAAPEH